MFHIHFLIWFMCDYADKWNHYKWIMLMYICNIAHLFNLIKSTIFDKWTFFIQVWMNFTALNTIYILFLYCTALSNPVYIETQFPALLFITECKFIFYSSLYFNSKSYTVLLFEFLYISVLQYTVLLFIYLYSVQPADMNIKTTD